VQRALLVAPPVLVGSHGGVGGRAGARPRRCRAGGQSKALG
jgi:hypothetical protein